MPRRLAVLLLTSAGLLAAGHVQVPPTVDKTLAPRLAAIVERIEKAAPSAKPRGYEFSEAELNAYAAYRLENAEEDVLRDLRLKLYPGNKIEGWMVLDFAGHRIPAWIKERMNLYFEGTLEVEPGRARFSFTQLFLEKEPMPLMMLDMIVFIASQLGKTDARGVEDWHDLPAAVKDIRTGQGRFTVWY
jgi:hypothetical protein